MKKLLIPLISTLCISCGAQAQKEAKAENADKAEPKYVAEAPLPKGWPAPGPFNKVSEKNFPAYRAAYTKGGLQNFAFWRLFNHIKRNEIPMTSPVEMNMKKKNDTLQMKSMGFLYQNQEVGKLGKDGKNVEVRNVPAMKTLCYTWQGKNSLANLKTAKEAIDAELKKRGITTEDFRVLGYNGPGVAKDKKTWEMLAILPAKVKQ